MQRIDAHLHLWHYRADEFDWLEGDLQPLRRDFLLQDCLSTLHAAQVTGAVVVQARQSLEETDWLLHLATSSPTLLGVVGWLPLRAPNFADLLASYRHASFLRGLRHVVQAEPDGFMDDGAFNAGIACLTSCGLPYDILVLERQLAEATRLVDRHPNQSFVLDHLAKPRIRQGELSPWSERIRELARRPNVVCKVSGMVTEADPHAWTPEQLRPYFDTVLEAFTPDRLMVGTDWPVMTAGCNYGQWWDVVEHWSIGLSSHERASLLGATAARVYGLSPLSELAHAVPPQEVKLP